MTSKKTISPNILYRLKKLFTDQKWVVDGDNEDPVFDSFCEMLSFLNGEQQECILELTKKFLKIDFSKYHYHLRRALHNIPKQTLENLNKVFVLPLLTKEDFGKPKSSQFLVYILRGWEIKAKDILHVNSVQVLEKREWLKPILTSNDWKLILADDFIGTGETAETAINELIRDTGIDKNKIIVLSLVSQHIGYQRLALQGITVVCSELRTRGITDDYIDPVRQEYLNVMKSIEDMLGLKPEFRYGYKGSEALVTFIRTPNNTFPIYWEKSKIKDKKWVAPFPRNG
jgi:hypothetical protein